MDEIKVGFVFYDREKTLGRKKYLIVNIFEDSSESVVTYRFWSKTKKRYFYNSEFLWELETCFKFNLFVKKYKSNEK